MNSIKDIPLDQLLDDKAASQRDITLCQLALLHGHTTYSGGKSTQERLEINQRIVAMIDVELARRGQNN